MNDLNGLNAAQSEAVCHVDGPLLILAGPGSGKTRVVTHRIAYLLEQGVSAKQILALTFTNKAADEMRQRLSRLAPRQEVWMGTFHRFGAQFLRVHAPLAGLSENYSILDSDDSGKLLRRVIDDLALDLTHVTPDSIGAAISWAKSSLVTAQEYVPRPGHPLGPLVAAVYPAFQKRLLEANAVDFDDLLLHTATILRENPELRQTLDDRYRYILVDEYQDTNMAQYAIVRALSVDFPNLAVTGDPDQSIYGWRGANLSNILEFERDYPGVRVVRLEENYRSTQLILSVAQQLISHNVRRKEKLLHTANDEGRPVRLIMYASGRDEADDIATQILQLVQSGDRRPRDFAILYRTNALSRLLEHALRSRGVPYQIIHGLEFYQRKEIKDVMAYLQLLNNPRNDVALERIINTPARSIGKSTVARLNEFARGHRISLLESARAVKQINDINNRSATAVAKFVQMVDLLFTKLDAPLHELMSHVLDASGYREQLQASEYEEDQERLANLDELLNAAREFDEDNPGDNRLERFLEQTALVADTDDWESESDQVTLMTLHAAKGLEFPMVYIVALEEGILPHERNLHDRDKLEEERRLLFVGITRAAVELQLSMGLYRMRSGRQWPTVGSQFLMELPREEMAVVEPGAASRERREEQSWHADETYDDEWRQEEPVDDFAMEFPPPAKAAKICTAAELLGEANQIPPPPAPTVPPESFRSGMLVTHPDYGPGRIISVSGTGDKRTATVKFATAGERSFRLAFCPLMPVYSGRE